MSSFLERFFSSLTAAQRLLAFLFVVGVSAALVAFLAGGLKTGIPTGILILLLLWFTRSLWTPSDSGHSRIALSSLTVISTVALAVLGKTPEAKPWFTKILEGLGITHASVEQGSSLNPYLGVAVLVFVLIGVYVVNRAGRDESIMRIHPKPLDEDFPEQGYKEKLQRFCKVLQTRLDTLDEETKWDDYYFAPLEAEVEIVDSRQIRKRRIVDLMHALRGDRHSQIILVLGDPGSGKSIALRKLSKELLARSGENWSGSCLHQSQRVVFK